MNGSFNYCNMKKSVFYNLFLSVMALATAGSFTSCKDTYQDHKDELQSQINYQASVSETLQGQIVALQTELATLEALQKQCQSNCAAEFNTMNNKIADLEKLIKTVNAASESGDEKLQQQVDSLKLEVEKLLKEISDLQGEIASLKAQDVLLQGAIDTLSGTLADVREQVSSNTKGIADLVDAVDKVNKAVVDAASKAGEAYDLAVSAGTTASDALGKANQNATDIDALKKTVDSLNGTIAGWGDRLVAVEKAAADAMAKAQSNETRISTLESLLKELDELTTGLGNKIDSIDADLKKLSESLDEAKKDITAASSLAEAANTLAGEAKSIAQDALAKANDALTKYNTLDTELNNVKTAYQQADAELRNDITELQTAVAEVQTSISAINSTIETLSSKLSDSWNELITDIIIQGTYNPFFGEMAVPLNLRSNVLCALYGTAVNDVYFPTDKSSCYVDADDIVFTEADVKMLGGFNKYWFDAQDYVIDEEEGNAGTLYLTVNPTNVNFTGTTFSLVNSLDEESGVKLGALKASNHLLSFGWTRAENGFYESKATLAAEDIDDVKANIQLDDFKDIVKDILSYKDGFNLSNIYKTLEENVSEILEADGVKATWTDALSGETRSIYSQYGVAATALKPLSFSFLKDWNAPQIPHISPINYDLKMKIDYAGYHDVPQQDLTVVIDVDGVPQTYTVQGVDELINSINDKVGGSLVTDIDHLIDQIKGQAEDNVDNILSKVNTKVIKRVNSVIDRVNGYIKNVNHYLQPCMVYQANSGTWYQVSDVWYAPTHFRLGGEGEQGVAFTPTTFSAEILAPAFKKLVGVTNVYSSDYSKSAQDGDETCLMALKKANASEGMNTVYSGPQDVLFLTDSAYAGYVYEIAYTAVDYSGKVVAKKYYVKVVD